MSVDALRYGQASDASEQRVWLTDDYMQAESARAVPNAHFDRAAKWWVVDQLEPRGAAVICRLFPHVADKRPDLLALRDTLLSDARPFDNATPFWEKAGSPELHSLPIRQLRAEGHQPYHFQTVDLAYAEAVLRKHSVFELAWERGMGKTLAALHLGDTAGAQRILVVCTNTAKDPVWGDETRRFIGSHEVIVLPNKGPERRAAVLKRVQMMGDPFVFVIHYEALALVAKLRKDWNGWHKMGTWDMVVVDESHRFSNPDTQQHRALRHVPTEWKLSMTGSMIMNHPEEIYGRLNWMLPDSYSSKWRDWNDRFLDYVDSGHGRVLIGPKPDTIDELRRELGIITVYRRKADELDLPPKVEQTLRLDLSPKQRAIYDELRDSYVADLGPGESVVALQPVVLLTRLRQVATGLELVSGTLTDSAKLDAAVELVRDNPDSAFVIFSWFKGAAEAVAARLRGLNVGTFLVTGDTPHAKRTRQIAEFQSGAGRVFVGTISTLGESVNLHRADQAIFLDRSWNPAQNDQAVDRIYRIGQERPITVTYLVAKDTVDEYNVLPTLNTKEQLRRMILGGL